MKSEIHDAVFGLLKQNSDFPYYYGSTLPFSTNELFTLKLNFELINQEMENLSNEILSIVLEQAHKLYASLQIQEDTVRKNLATYHLSLEYDWWNTREEPINIDDFVSRITLFGISLTIADNSYDCHVGLDYNVKHQFGSHYLYANVNSQMVITDTEFRM